MEDDDPQYAAKIDMRDDIHYVQEELKRVENRLQTMRLNECEKLRLEKRLENLQDTVLHLIRVRNQVSSIEVFKLCCGQLGNEWTRVSIDINEKDKLYHADFVKE